LVPGLWLFFPVYPGWVLVMVSVRD